METTHLLCRTQLHEEELRLVKADLVILGKFFELLPSGSDREKIFDSPLFRQVVLEVLRKAFSSAGVLSFFFRRRLQTDGCPSLPARPNLVGKNESNVYLCYLRWCQRFAANYFFSIKYHRITCDSYIILYSFYFLKKGLREKSLEPVKLQM